jgi:hypothetical protein
MKKTVTRRYAEVERDTHIAAHHGGKVHRTPIEWDRRIASGRSLPERRLGRKSIMRTSIGVRQKNKCEVRQ